jgi:hypothetical protein
MLGDLDTGYNYNELLYQEDLSPAALYGNYVVAGIVALALVFVLWPSRSSKGGRRHKGDE